MFLAPKEIQGPVILNNDGIQMVAFPGGKQALILSAKCQILLDLEGSYLIM